jgi:hypothetical protein
MPSSPMSADTTADTPEGFPVAVLVAREALRDNPWQSERWRVVGLVAGQAAAGPAGRSVVRADADATQFLDTGLTLALYRDEVESYYHNLMSPVPSVFVVCQPEDSGALRTIHVTPSHDAAEAYMQGDGQVFPVAMPPEVYRWVEAYVLEHYVPEQRQKRKREAWNEGPSCDWPS